MPGKKEDCTPSLGTILTSMINVRNYLNLPHLNGIPGGP